MTIDSKENPDRELLGRLDERTKAIQSSIDKMNFDVRLQMDSISKKIDDLENRTNRRIETVEKDLQENYISRQEFNPIQKIVYGVVGLILVAVAGAVLALVMAQPKFPMETTHVGG